MLVTGEIVYYTSYIDRGYSSTKTVHILKVLKISHIIYKLISIRQLYTNASITLACSFLTKSACWSCPF